MLLEKDYLLFLQHYTIFFDGVYAALQSVYTHFLGGLYTDLFWRIIYRFFFGSFIYTPEEKVVNPSGIKKYMKF